MRKISSIFAILAAAALVFGISAADTTVYVGSGRIGAYSTLETAIAQLHGKGGTVVLCEAVTVTEQLVIPEQTGDLTITAEGDGRLVFAAATLTLEKNTNTNTVTFDMPLTTPDAGLTVFGGFNSVVFGENFDVTGIVNFYGGVDAADGLSGVTTSKVEENAALNRACITEIDYAITVKNGSFGAFSGGNRRAAVTGLFGAIAAKLDITIAGGTFTYQGDCGMEDALKNDPAFSISGMSILAHDATLTITGGTFDTPIYAVSGFYPNKTEASAGSLVTRSDPKYYAMDGDITIDITGGTFTEKCYEISAVQQTAAFNLLLRGNYTVNIGAGASLADGTVLDATQVKAYSGVTDKIAALYCAASASVVPKRFDTVNGEAKTYEEPLRIACIGDSITQGTSSGNYGTNSYPARLYTKLHGEGRDVVVSNFGCGGWTVMNYDGKYYPAGLAYTLSIHETDADIVIVGLGTNDSRFFNTVGQHDHFYQEYRDLILSYAELDTTEKVYGTSAIYRADKLAIEASQIVRHHQERVFKDLAAAGNEKTVYVDLYELTLEAAYAGTLLSSDRLHPDAAGYKVYADAVYDVLFGSGVTEKPVEKRTEIYVDYANGTESGAGTKEDPTKYLANAFEMADRDAEEVTVYIVGTYGNADREESTDTTNTPLDLQKLRIVGVADADGNKAKWSLSTKYLYFNCDTELDNIILEYSGSTAVYMHCCFNNVTLTESFEMPDHGFLFAGHNVYNENVAAKRYTPAYTVSSDEDCEITVLGGRFYYFYGGNRHYPSDSIADKAPYGTYGGNMKITIGENVEFSSKYASALCGMNYLTGTITASVASWNAGQPILTYSPITTNSTLAADYNESMNTGEITVSGSVENTVIRAGDLNKDGAVDLADVLTMVRCTLNGDYTEYDSRYYYDKTELSLVNVLRALKRIVQ